VLYEFHTNTNYKIVTKVQLFWPKIHVQKVSGILHALLATLQQYEKRQILILAGFMHVEKNSIIRKNHVFGLCPSSTIS
jgi:hypothetical protein